ncbi:unnamed protein product, partial [marine sediment metagenome]
MKALKESLELYPRVKDLIEECESNIISNISKNIGDFSEIVQIIDKAIVENPPATMDQGGIIRKGYSQELDELREISLGGKNWLLQLEQREKEKTGIASLKIAFNSVFGYYIEVTKSNLHLVPASYIRKQTLSNKERFYTPELKGFEQKILGAEEKIRILEYELYVALREDIVKSADLILATTRAIAILDVIQGFSQNAVINNYSKPIINNGNKIIITDSRHPVVEKILEKGSYIPNDVLIDRNANQILIITGPNMAGKSTYLRQVALITI